MMCGMWIDTHCHLDAPEFDADRDEVVARARRQGVQMLVIPAVRAADFERTREMAHHYGAAYALGIHPLFTPQAQTSDLDRLEQALQRHADDPRLVAVGEIGLDHAVPGVDRDTQQHFYCAQLALAAQYRLPVILHVRRSAQALLDGLRAHAVAGGLAHAFNASQPLAAQFVCRGFALGFGGAMTHERALQIRRLAASLPPSALVLETDAPDIPPQWLYRTAAQRAGGMPQGRNEPAHLPRMAQTLSALRGWSTEEVAHITTANALRSLPRLHACWRCVPAVEPVAG